MEWDSEAPILLVRDLARRFGRRWALGGVSLEVDHGEAVALIGPNGSGKTTLLRIVSTLLRPTRGGGRVGGHDLAEQPVAVRRHVGLLGHSTGLYPDLTAAENLAFASRMHGRSPDRPRIMNVLNAVGMASDSDRRVRGFSAGMRRRVALGRLMLFPPDLLLLDEPFTSFDAEGVELLLEFTDRIRAAGGGVLLATHDLERARTAVDRFVTLRAGQVVARGIAGNLGRRNHAEVPEAAAT